MSEIQTAQRKTTMPMVYVAGAIFLAGGLWMVSIVHSFSGSSAPTQVAAAERPAVNVYVTNPPQPVVMMPQQAASRDAPQRTVGYTPQIVYVPVQSSEPEGISLQSIWHTLTKDYTDEMPCPYNPKKCPADRRAAVERMWTRQ